MLEKLDFMFRFWELRARHETLGAPLSTLEQVEFLSLLQLLATDIRLPDPGPAPLTTRSIPIRLTAAGGFAFGELRGVRADGLVVACDASLVRGKGTIARLTNPATGLEYTLPCVVEWAFTRAPRALGLRVDGPPTRMTCASTEPSPWGAPFGWIEPRPNVSR